jgi:hypothetical protein
MGQDDPTREIYTNAAPPARGRAGKLPGLVMHLTELDFDAWAAARATLPDDRREVYWHPAYAATGAAWEGARPACLAVRSAGGTLLYPYLVHPVAENTCDVQTAYGYGGPMFTGEWSAGERRAALGKVGEHFRSHGAVAEFVRCHTEWVDHGDLGDAGYRAFQVRTNVECELSGDDVTATWTAGARRNLRKAAAAGLTHRPGEGPADWATFGQLYAATAARLDMAASYRFDAAYFRALAAVPGVRLILVECDRVPVAGAVLFVGGALAHYHLGASDFAFADRRPNDFLYIAMARTARAAGCARAVWGGGMSNDPADSLMRFKTHFGEIRRPVYCAGRVIDPDGYARLCDAWARRNPDRQSALFLKYRA